MHRGLMKWESSLVKKQREKEAQVRCPRPLLAAIVELPVDASNLIAIWAVLSPYLVVGIPAISRIIVLRPCISSNES